MELESIKKSAKRLWPASPLERPRRPLLSETPRPPKGPRRAPTVRPSARRAAAERKALQPRHLPTPRSPEAYRPLAWLRRAALPLVRAPSPPPSRRGRRLSDDPAARRWAGGGEACGGGTQGPSAPPPSDASYSSLGGLPTIHSASRDAPLGACRLRNPPPPPSQRPPHA